MSADKRSVLERVRRHLLEIPGYEPVDPPDVMARRLGIPQARIVKLDGNENPYGASPRALQALAADGVQFYPDPMQTRVREAIADYAGATPEQIVLGVGSDEILAFAATLFLSAGDALVNCPPTFGVYDFLGRVSGARVIDVPRMEDFSLDFRPLERALEDSAALLYLASPNNPTGNVLPREDLERLLRHGVPIVVDEAYAEFAGESAVELVSSHDNLIVARTFSKWAGLAGVRAGYGVFPEDLADIVWKVKVPYNLSVVAERAVLASLEDKEVLDRNVGLILAERERLAVRLAELAWLRVFPSQANFVLCEVKGLSARQVRDDLRQQGILVRYFDSAGLRNCIRISVGKPEHTDRVIEALTKIGSGVAR